MGFAAHPQRARRQRLRALPLPNRSLRSLREGFSPSRSDLPQDAVPRAEAKSLQQVVGLDDRFSSDLVAHALRA